MNNLTSKGGGEISRSWKNLEKEEYKCTLTLKDQEITICRFWNCKLISLFVNLTTFLLQGLESNFQKTQRLQVLGPRLDREYLTYNR